MIPALDAVHADPWARDLLDLAALNANASGAVEEAIERIRRGAAADPHALRSTSLVILGPPGAGKTHLFARLRRRVGPRAVFVHVRPLVHAEMTVRFVLSEVVRQLAFLTPQGMPQANALVGSLLGALGGVGSAFPSTVLSEYAEASESQRIVRLTAALEQVLSIWPEIDETYLERLLNVPFSAGPQNRALLAWLSGRDCDAVQLERIGAATSLGEEQALGALRTLSAVAALGAPLVIVFDQLENLIDSDGSGPRLRAYGHLASECVDVLRGAVLVHLALDSEWERGIEPSFNASQRSRIVMRREVLSLPRAAEREELLRLLAERLPMPREAFPWPLGAARLTRLRAQPGITPRLLLVEFRQALESDAQDDVEPTDGASTEQDALVPGEAPAEPSLRDLDGEWQSQLRSARELVHAACEARESLDAARLADGFLATAQFLPGLRVSAGLRPPAALLLERESSSEQLAVLQESNHRSVGAALVKLTQLTQKSRVLVVRERARELPPTWKETRRARTALLETGRARWVDVDAEDCARVLAMAALLQAARSGEVTCARGAQVSEAEVREWVSRSLGIDQWPISAELSHTGRDDDTGDLNGRSEALAPASVAGEVRGRAGASRPSQAAAGSSGVALSTLRRLRVASLDRLVREVARVDGQSSRASILKELEAAGDRVTWFGRSIMGLKVKE